MPSRYRLRVAEALDPAWAAWLGNLTVTRTADGATTITGLFSTQEQLFQLLHKMGELGMTLLAVEMTQEVDCTVLSHPVESTERK
ncbi:MAG: hypothetical protein R3A44_12930 [Caldilineaceae bacterium]